MSVRNKFIHFSNWAKVKEYLSTKVDSNVVDENTARTFLGKKEDNPLYYWTCFISEPREIYTHGKFYKCTDSIYDDTEIRSLLNLKIDFETFQELVDEVSDNEKVTVKALLDLKDTKLDKSTAENFATKTSVESLEAEMAYKANQSDLNSLIENVEINRESVNNALDELKNTKLDSDEAVNFAKIDDILSLRADVETRAKKSDLENLSSEVSENEKVTAAALTDLDTRIKNIQSVDVSNLATKDELNTLESELSTKVDTTTFTNLSEIVAGHTTDIANLSNNKADKTELEDFVTVEDFNELSDKVETKQDILTLDDFATINDQPIFGSNAKDITITEPDHFANTPTSTGSGIVANVEFNDNGHITKVSKRALTDSDIPSFSADKIASGTISIDRLPVGALERMFVVESETAAMSATVQEGDVVQVTGNDNKMYFCISNTETTFANKFKEFTAGTATSVPWSGITDKPDLVTQDELDVVANNYLPLSGGKMSGSIIFKSGYSLKVTDSNNSEQHVLYLDPSSQNLLIGYQTGISGKHGTSLYGNNIHLKSKGSTATTMLLNNNGNVTVGASDLAGENYKMYVDGTLYAKNISVSGGSKYQILRSNGESSDWVSPTVGTFYNNTARIFKVDGIIKDGVFYTDVYNIGTRSANVIKLISSTSDDLKIFRAYQYESQGTAMKISKIQYSGTSIYITALDYYNTISVTDVNGRSNLTITVVDSVPEDAKDISIAKILTDVTGSPKLATARKIWGQSFDGTKDISGQLSGVTSMYGAKNNADSTYSSFRFLPYTNRLIFQVSSYDGLEKAGRLEIAGWEGVNLEKLSIMSAETTHTGTLTIGQLLTANAGLSSGGAITLTGTTADSSTIAFSRTTYNYITSPSGGDIGLQPGGLTKNSATGYKFTVSEFRPGADNVYNLGLSTHKWKNVYATTFVGSLNGNATSATTLGSYTTTKKFSLNANSGYPKIVLINDITDLWGLTGQGTKHYGFVGDIITRRIGGYANDVICRINARIGYNGDLSTSGNKLQSDNSTIIPVIVKYSDKYYIGLTITGGDKGIELRGSYINPIETITQLNYVNATTLPEGVELISEGSVISYLTETKASETYLPIDGTAVNSNKLNGLELNTSNKPYGKIPYVGNSGVMEVGKYLDFHYDNVAGTDYSLRLQCSIEGEFIVNLPKANGTIALTSEIPIKLSDLQDDVVSGNYLPIDGTAVAATQLATPRTIWGQSFDGTGDIDGNITINGGIATYNSADECWEFSGKIKANDFVTNTSEVVVNQFKLTTTLNNSIINYQSDVVSSPFMAIIKPVSGFDLSNVTITMGGEDISYANESNGVIIIPDVTGDINIVANSTVNTPSYVGDDNDITLELPSGEYTLIYEDANGNQIDNFDEITTLNI